MQAPAIFAESGVGLHFSAYQDVFFDFFLNIFKSTSCHFFTEL
jgi:hypothetical protein